MATQACPECQGAVSPMAYHCPQCRQLTDHGRLNILVRVMLLGFLAYNLFRSQPF